MEIDAFLDEISKAALNLMESSKDSMSWYKKEISDIVKKDPSNLFKKYSSPEIGGMYLYLYDPKYKDTLPFYDAFPLVIPIEFYGNGFLGINLHYLPPGARSQLLAGLINIAGNDKKKTVKFNLSYELLSKYASQFPGAKNCVKRYLFSQVRSSFHYVQPEDWQKVVTMPLQKFKVNPDRRYAGSPPY
jgi:hypothetical protein